MKSALIFACLCAASPLGFGYQADSINGSIEGQVVNSATGAPIRGASVTLSYNAVRAMQPGQAPALRTTPVAETDAQGRFAFRDLQPGGYRITVQRPGYSDQFNFQTYQQQLYYVGERQQLKGVLLKLVPQAVIAGKVLDENGDPLEGAQVSVLREQSYQGKSQWMPTRSAQTSDLGEYRISGIPAGRYLVSASYRNPRMGMTFNQPLPEKPELTYATTYYPDALDQASAKMVNADAGGEVRNIDIKIGKRPTVRVRGIVIDPSGVSNQTAMIQLVPKDGYPGGGFYGSLYGSIFNSDGSFEISGVAPGSYYVVARKNIGGMVNSSTPVWGAVQALEVGDKSIDGIVLKLSLGTDVKGSIRVEENTPVDLRNLNIMLSPMGGMFGGVNPVRGLDGPDFTLKNVSSGMTAVTVQGYANGYYVKSIQYGGKEVPATGADLTAGESLSIVLSTRGATLAGKVVDAAGQPVAHAMLRLVPADGQPDSSDSSMVSRLGEFHFYRMLRPGDYKLYAWESTDNSLAQNPELWKRFEAKAKPVKLTANGHETVTVTVIPAAEFAAAAGNPSMPAVEHPKGSIEGQVVHAKTGAPVSAAMVRLGSQCNSTNRGGGMGGVMGSFSNSMTPQSTGTDDQGRFAFHDVEPGMHQLCAEHQGFTAIDYGQRRDVPSESLVVGDGQRLTNLVLKLAPQAVLSGKVVDDRGDPMAGVAIAPMRWEYREGKRTYLGSGGTRTNDLGEFRVAGLPAGPYLITIRPDPPISPSAALSEPMPDQPDMGYPTTYYPASLDAATAKAVALGSGAETDLKIALQKTAMLRVRGTVTGRPAQASAAGRPAPPIALTLLPVKPDQPSSPRTSATAKPDGSFAFSGILPGSYRLVAQLTSDGARPLAAAIPVEVKDKHVDGLKLELAPGREVTASVTADTTMRLDGFSLNLMQAYPSGRNSNARLQNDETKLVFHDVLPVPYKVNVTSMPFNCHCYVKSIKYGGQEIPEDGVDPATGAPLEIVLSASAGTLDGTVVDAQGKPAGGSAVAILAKDGPLSSLKTAVTDGRGKFQFSNIAPGEYEVLAWEDAEIASFYEPGYLKGYEARAKLVQLPPSGRATVQVTALPAK